MFACPTHLSCHSLEQKSHAKLVKAQKDDVTLGPVISILKDGKWPVEEDSQSEIIEARDGTVVIKGRTAP